jgi:hypothetical protein
MVISHDNLNYFIYNSLRFEFFTVVAMKITVC